MIFGSKLKHKDWRVRNKAVKSLTNIEQLYEIATTDDDWHVRLSAAERIDEEGKLYEIAKSDQEEDVRYSAVQHISTPKLLEELLKEEINDEVRQAINLRLGKEVEINDLTTENWSAKIESSQKSPLDSLLVSTEGSDYDSQIARKLLLKYKKNFDADDLASACEDLRAILERCPGFSNLGEIQNELNRIERTRLEEETKKSTKNDSKDQPPTLVITAIFLAVAVKSGFLSDSTNGAGLGYSLGIIFGSVAGTVAIWRFAGKLLGIVTLVAAVAFMLKIL